MTIKITPNDKGNPPGKLADAELHFTDGPLEGLKLIGFAIWERRGGGGGRNVTFPARQYSVNGERRSFALLRPIVDTTAQNKHSRADSRGVSGVRGARGDRHRERLPNGAAAHWITGSSRAFSCCRFGGSVHSSRSAFSNSAWKNDAFMPPSMMSHGSTASRLRSRKM